MAIKVAGELYESITGQLFEIGRQLRQPNGYPYNPEHLKVALQNAIEGKFGDMPKKPVKPVLNFHEEVSVGPLAKRFVPDEFFKDRADEGDEPQLEVYDDKFLLQTAQVVEPTEIATKLRSFTVTKYSNDRKIKAELPEDHKVELWQIADLITIQKTGESGSLLANGRRNIFYVANYVVCVHCEATDPPAVWLVGISLAGENYESGDRIFSCN